MPDEARDRGEYRQAAGAGGPPIRLIVTRRSWRGVLAGGDKVRADYLSINYVEAGTALKFESASLSSPESQPGVLALLGCAVAPAELNLRPGLSNFHRMGPSC
jgi:hypothetical protein